MRLVFLEDDESSVELVRALLAEEGLVCELTHAYDETTYRAALAPTAPDIILSDFNLPTIDGMMALELRNQLCPDTPFVLVSGAVGEPVAISLLKSGATDFVLKDELPRLLPAIRRSLAEAREHHERVRAEESLRESEARFRRLAENAPDVIFRYQWAGGRWRCEYISATVHRITGYRPEEFYGDSFLPLRIVHRKDRGAIHDLLRRRAVPPAAAEIRWVTRDGRIVITDQRFVPVFDAREQLIAIEGIARDVTEVREAAERRRMLELQLNQAQKMESIGALAGGIAHDFNNILTGILGFTELAQIEAGNDARVCSTLGEVRKAGLRAKDLVAQILTFSRQQEALQVPVDLSRIVGEALKFLRASAPSTIGIERRLTPCSIVADPSQIHQVVLNLCTNSLHAMRGTTGTLTVQVERIDVEVALAATMSKVDPGPHACLMVQDTGHGMDKDVLARIFDPFFTTKPVGEGTGLGLSVVQGIVLTNHGGITVASEVGQGTTFRVFFPICDRTVVTAAEKPPVVPGAGQHILVVDDETSVATFLEVRLQQLNYRPAIFTDPRRAIAAVAAAPRRFSALVTDLTMPGMTGIELVRQVRRIAGDLPVVLVTGNRSGLASVEDLGRFAVVDKPFSGDDLARVLHQFLTGAPAGHERKSRTNS